jgi:Domain of unknown function (DUF4389)
MAARPIYPVRLEGRLQPGLSRWLWLVKWLLAIPHFIVLAFLWVAFVVLSIVAFFAILFTARYPRGIFEFNLGVLRWTWRVAFYSYAALGTDRYPPFTLGAAPDYPATLDVAYPAELSRGLVLVKWWLLAIPHYLVVGVFLGGGWFAWGGSWDHGRHNGGWGGGPGLIALLVLFAAVGLLFTTRYPRGIFDFVLGLDRWVARVAAYAGLMTDVYPPFHLDQGEEEPRAHEFDEPPIPPPTGEEPAETTRPTGRGAGGVALLVVGGIAALLAFALLVGGVGAVVVDRTQRDDDGFLMSPTESFSTATYAIASENTDVNIDGPDWATKDLVGTLRIRSESERAVFVGIARAADLVRYLGGVERAVVTEIGRDPHYSARHGRAPAGPPADQTFWAASATGAGEQTLEWEPEDGSWNAVVMNADGSRGVAADLSIGAELDPLIWIGVALLVGGALLAAAAALAITAGIRRGRPARPSRAVPKEDVDGL